jgi:hypothetical protein
MKKWGNWATALLTIFALSGQTLYAQINVILSTESISMRLNAVVAEKSSSTIVYPREYNVYGSMGGCVYGRGFIIASKDFTTQWLFSNGTWNEQESVVNAPYFVSDATPNYHMDRSQSAVELNITHYWRYQAPLREVNLTNYSDSDWRDAIANEVGGEDMVSDQMVKARCNTAHGIRLEQRAYAFWDPKYDDFIIVEYIFKNTGSIDVDRIVEYENNKVKDCYIGLKFVPQVSSLSSTIIPSASGWMPQLDDWIDYYKGTYDNEAIRVMYGWDGDARTEYYEPDDEGDPFPATGIFMSPQYPGMAILHVDKAVNDPANDPDQPIMSYYSYGGANATNALSLGSMAESDIWSEFNKSEFFTNPFDWDTWNTTQTEIWNTPVGNDPNIEYYKTGTLGFGPYNFENLGDSVRMVVCYAVGSMGWANSVEIGQKWKNGEISKTEKNRYLRSGRDSLFTKIAQVSQMFKDTNGDFDLMKGAGLIGTPLPSPGLKVTSDLRTIILEWEDVGAAKYRIYRRLKSTFTLQDDPSELAKDPYPMIEEVDGSVTSWTDNSVSIGNDYWYCVTSVDDTGLESPKFLTRTNPTSSKRSRGAAQPYSALPSTAADSVYVVPNPYHRKSEQLYGRMMTAGNIKFYGLPPQCRIRVYSQAGDLVATLDHELTFPPNSVSTWNMLTDSDQYISPGMYFFTIDEIRDHLGIEVNKTKVGKFVIIR